MATKAKTPKTPKIVASMEAGLKAIQNGDAKAPKKASPKADKAKRVSLNPQPVIDAKTAALKELGVKLTYAGRLWKAGDRTFTSLEFSKYSVEAFAKLFPTKA